MKKTPIIFTICFLFLVNIAYSSLIEVGISQNLKGNISSITYDNTSNIVKFSIEFYNTGSVGYKARIRASIFYADNKLIFNGWSHEKDLMPGEKKSFDIYWHSNNTGKYFAKLKAHFGNEILEYKEFEFSINKPIASEDVFEIKDFRTYDDYLIFDVKSKENAKDVVVIPYGYPLGWIFEQKELVDISKDGSKLVILNYYPTLWTQSNISLIIASDKGKYYTEKTFEIKKNEGLLGFLFYIIDMFRIRAS